MRKDRLAQLPEEAGGEASPARWRRWARTSCTGRVPRTTPSRTWATRPRPPTTASSSSSWGNGERPAAEGRRARRCRRSTDGGFGDCERCGETIGEKRLEALPFARYCIDCQRGRRRRADRRRLSAPPLHRSPCRSGSLSPSLSPPAALIAYLASPSPPVSPSRWGRSFRGRPPSGSSPRAPSRPVPCSPSRSA